MTTRERAVVALRQALVKRSAALVETRSGRRPEIAICARGNTIAQGRLSARAAGTWQSNTEYGVIDAPEEPERFWIFVDLIPDQPAFYIAPEWFVMRNIAREHAKYLARNGGERAVTKDSTHHQISLPRIERWRDRWDVLGL
jgi:hypothetical protein